jgi:hypothetical protein
MKKLMAITMVLMVGLVCLLGCGGSPLVDTGFTEVSDGNYTRLDTAGSPLPQGGVKIDLVTGPQGSVKFTVTDDAGTETADYYLFTPTDSTMLRHRYVAAMGMTYNYYFDYAATELVRVTDADDADVTERLKSGGRWDGAASETKEHAEALLGYFETSYGMTIDEAVAQ